MASELTPVPDEADFGPGVAGLEDGQQVFGRYTLRHLLGRGSMSAVWLAHDNQLEREVALKFFPEKIRANPEVLNELKREARRSLTLNHPHIIRIFDFMTDATMAALSMEFIDGKTLAAWLAENEKHVFEVEEIHGWIAQTGQALHYVHNQARVIHGDLKPTNLILTAKGDVKVADFGLARVLRDSTTIDGIGRVWTPALVYLSPQQLSGARAQVTDDIYSLGATIYELLTGKPPFYSGDIPHQIQSMVPPSMAERRAQLGLTGREIPHEWEKAVTACLQKDPERRPPSMLELMERLAVSNAPRRTASRGTSSFATSAVLSKAPEKSPVYDENVQFTVYRPKVVTPEKWHTLLAFAHLSEKAADAPESEPDPVQEVSRQAQQILGQSANYADITQDSNQAIPRESEITMVPVVEGVEFNPPRRGFLWQEAVHREEFRMRLAGTVTELPKTLRGRITVFLGSLIIAEIPLTFRADATAGGDPEKNTEMAQARPYRKIFASYSHRDMEIVEHLEHYGKALGDRYLRDVLDLRCGEQWNPRLLEMIKEADIFQLFWSSNSMMSPYVRQEWEYALSLNRSHFIRPTYWENPLPEAPQQGLPPATLRSLHFQRIESAQLPPQAAPPREEVAPPRPTASRAPRAPMPEVASMVSSAAPRGMPRSAPSDYAPKSASSGGNGTLIIIVVAVLVILMALAIYWLL